MLSGFDHVTIVARDLEAAVASYSRLFGRAPDWHGEHPELGTHAALFGLQNSWIELVAPDRSAPEAEAMRARIEASGEGLQALAFLTDDAARCSATLRERGLRATPPQPGEARGADGRLRTYRTVELSARATRGLSVFAVERRDANALPQPPVAADELASALDHVVIRTADPDAAIALYGGALGLRLALDRGLAGTRMLFFRIGGVTVEFVHDASCGQDVLWGLAYRVRDIDAARARLSANGFSVSDVRPGKKPQTRVFTLRDGTCGVPTLILRDPARE